MYYRFTNSSNPMSDWGHAMFAEGEKGREKVVDSYGDTEYLYDGKHGVNIAELEELIKNTWNTCQNEEEFGNLNDEYYYNLTADEIYNSFNCKDIVNSAEAWDCELVVWFWEYIAEPNDIMAVITNDGAIVFDPTLIVKVGEKE